jgi:hypothetical protein
MVKNGRTRKLRRALGSSNSDRNETVTRCPVRRHFVGRSAEPVEAQQESLEGEQFAGVEGKVR